MIVVERGGPECDGCVDPAHHHALTTYARGRTASAGDRWLPIPIPADAASLVAASSAQVRTDRDIRMWVVTVDAPSAVTHRFAAASVGYVFALAGDLHLATDTDAAELSVGGRATILDEPEFWLRARSRSATVLLIESNPSD
jgi:redox-sensitive bicupin YhaK (pirin superfamily)